MQKVASRRGETTRLTKSYHLVEVKPTFVNSFIAVDGQQIKLGEDRYRQIKKISAPVETKRMFFSVRQFNMNRGRATRHSRIEVPKRKYGVVEVKPLLSYSWFFSRRGLVWKKRTLPCKINICCEHLALDIWRGIVAKAVQIRFRVELRLAAWELHPVCWRIDFF